MSGRSHATACAGALGDRLRPPAVVLDVSFVNGLEAIRSLHGRAPVMAVDHRPAALGLRSRLGGRPALARSGRRARRTSRSCRARRRAARAGRRLPDPRRAARGGRPATAERPRAAARPARAGTCSSRCSTSATSTRPPARAGVGIPRTSYPQTGPRPSGRGRAALPAIVKPSSGVEFKRRFGRPGAGLRGRRTRCSGLRGRARQSSRCCRRSCPAATTSLGRSARTHGDGAARSALFCGRKLLQMPRTSAPAGSARRAGATTPSSEALRCCSELGYHGIAQTEFRLTRATASCG